MNSTTPIMTDLAAEAIAIRELGATVLDATDIGVYALEYGLRNWPVFPLNGKVPAIGGGRGVLDATTDVARIIGWWSGPYRNANIGGRVPETMFVLDVDPRHGGDDSLAELEGKHGRLSETLTTLSGRGDGGAHYFYRRPAGKLSSRRLGAGIDLKTSTGYVVAPPSIHPDSGKPYTRVDAPVAAPPAWLTGLLLPPALSLYRPSSMPVAGGRFSLRCLVNRITAAPDGRRNITLYGACKDAADDGNLDAFEPDLVAAALAIGLSEPEIRATVASARRSAI